MKNLTAIETLATGLLDGGGEVFTNFPGFMSHKLFSSLGGKFTSVNEKIAYEVAWGASFAGRRSITTFKNVGLNDAADPFLNSMLLGINAGMVVVVFDDVFVEASQSRQDSRCYYDFFKGLWFEPYSLQNAYDTSYHAFQLSEKFQVPVVIRITNQLLCLEGFYSRKKKKHTSHQVILHNQKFIVHPTHSAVQRTLLNSKQIKIQEYIDNLYKNEIKNLSNYKKLIISFGCNIHEEANYLDQGFKKLQIYTYPIPTMLPKLIAKIQNVTVLEQGNGFAYEKLTTFKNGDQNLESITGNIPDKSDCYIITDNYRKLFSAIKILNVTFVVGDLGEYTKDTLDSINACLCFGSSISVGLGSILAGVSNTISIIGDAAYLHSGKNIIPEAVKRNIPIKVIVICNGGSQGTGGQEIPGDLFYQPKEVKRYTRKYKTSTESNFKQILNKMLTSDCASVLYLLM